MTQSLRRVLLPIFQRINPGEVKVTHPWTSDRMLLHSFKHKGYWFHGKKRERATMKLFARLVGKNDCILDVGGHIGYTALYFSGLTGLAGRVFVFEPSPENLPYLQTNVDLCARKNITIVRAAAGDHNGTVLLNYETVTGQNSSIVPEFAGFAKNCRSNNLSGEYRQCKVNLITIDSFVNEQGLSPAFVKIDIEGAELQALDGMISTLETHRPRLMVEVNLNGETVWRRLARLKYKIYADSGERIRGPERLTKHTLNVFAFHESDHFAESVFGGLGSAQAGAA